MNSLDESMFSLAANPLDNPALLGAIGVAIAAAFTTIGVIGSEGIRSWRESKAEKIAARAASEAASSVKDNTFIDQLQEEIARIAEENHRYRQANDERFRSLEREVAALKEENAGYRAFIGVQRDHMAQHGIPLPIWPEGLPR